MRDFINLYNDQLFEHNENITYTTSPNHQQLSGAASLINAGGQLVISLNAASLENNTILVVVAVDGERVIGTASIKTGNEMGYLMVDPEYRRYGVARKLTEIRIEYARTHNLPLLYSSARKDNIASINNLRGMNFIHAGSKKSPYSENILSYFYLPITMSIDDATDYIRNKFRL